MIVTIIILLLAMVFFVHGKIRSDIIALCSLTALLIFQILTPEEALSGFANSTVIMMVGLFVVGGAIFQTGLAKIIGKRILKLAGENETRLLILVILATSAIGAFVSNTGTVALMLPIIISMTSGAGLSASRLLMPLAFASSMGGMMTLIGTPPNLIIADMLDQNGYQHLTFFSFLPSGIICVAVGTLVLIPLSKIFLSKRRDGKERSHKQKTLGQLVKEYGLSDNLFRIQVPKLSPIIGKTIRDIDANRQYHLNILEVRREDALRHRFLKTISQHLALANTSISAGDIFYIQGEFSDLQKFSSDYHLEILDSHASETANGKNHLDFYDIGIAEIIFTPNSDIVNKTVKDAGFRSKYDVNVLGIRRADQYILHDLGDEIITLGDVLLLQGSWANIKRIATESNNWVVIGQPTWQEENVELSHKAPIAATIMVLMVILMVFDFIPIAPVTAVILAGLLMVLTGCFHNVTAAYKTINWESIVLIAAMLPMSLALEKTGVSALISNTLVGSLGNFGPTAMIAGIYVTTSIMTMFISNTATAVLLAPIAMQSAVSMGVNPTPFLFAVSISASMCFASPFSTPPNALVMTAGKYTFMDYIKVGLPMQIIMGIVMIFVLPLIFKF